MSPWDGHMPQSEADKALDALGVTIVKPGELKVDLPKFIEAIGEPQRRALAKVLHEKYGIAVLSTVPMKKPGHV